VGVWLLLSCVAVADPLGGAWTFAGDGVLGVTEAPSGCDGARRIGLWGETWGTNGRVRAIVTEEPEGAIWLHFPVTTGLGEAIAAMRVEGEGALLPLGGRPGEWSVAMDRRPGRPDAAELAAAEDRFKVAVAREQAAWQAGAFLIRDGERTVGDVRFRGDDPPLVALYSPIWLTPGPVPADLREEASDMELRFSVEPTFLLEDALIRINVPLREVVVPMGPVPDTQELRFALEPGAITDDERALLVEAAMVDADRRETELVRHWGSELAREAAGDDGGCHSYAEMGDEFWPLVLHGYTVEIIRSDAGCAVDIEPKVKQHGRRFRGRIEAY
jgi:hypothetical protein